ncbi:uncharacterized protein LOC117374924 [Periophthalmus magnuspinnatus]|uniref:uncharacterized protein LOC117374924 n=1 Tax=Periophthalmus magnuspinnatus TaxID=409849 RepID=UPI00145A1C90|nr:uncharacterized protein LOC117374924 [Periophthalmus magnuspinnatus]
MKRSRAVLISCLLALAALSCVSAKTFLKLNTTNDLKRIYAEKKPTPDEHSVPLLYLLANDINIVNNNIYPNFDPTNDYGSHFYGNSDRTPLLDPTPQGCYYYTMGNYKLIKQPNTCSPFRKLPPYVCHPKGMNTNMNRARIVLCLSRETYRWRIHRVYLTQHYENWNTAAYDPARTFEVSPRLLRELQWFSLHSSLVGLKKLRDQYNRNIDNNQLNDIVKKWGGQNHAALALLLFLLNLFNRRMNRSYGSEPTSNWQSCALQDIYVDVVTGDNGYATIRWSGFSEKLRNDGAAIVLNNHKDRVYVFDKSDDSSGSLKNIVPLNEGLQVRLHKISLSHSWFWSRLTLEEEICRGEEFRSPDAVPITNYAKLQLFVRDGYSCFRLYIDNCSEWKSKFSNSWVALYASDTEYTSNYKSKQWQWVTKFKQRPDSGEFKIYEYCTGTMVAPGLQARFMIKDYNEEARTPEWPSPYKDMLLNIFTYLMHLKRSKSQQ